MVKCLYDMFLILADGDTVINNPCFTLTNFPCIGHGKIPIIYAIINIVLTYFVKYFLGVLKEGVRVLSAIFYGKADDIVMSILYGIPEDTVG